MVGGVPQLGCCRDRERSNHLLEHLEWIATRHLTVGPVDRGNAASCLEGELGPTPDERPPRPPLASFDRFEKEAGFVPDQLLEDGNGGLPIAENLHRQRHHLVIGGEFDEPVPR